MVTIRAPGPGRRPPGILGPGVGTVPAILVWRSAMRYLAGLVGLRAALEPIAMERDAVIEVRPHREARYEVFLEVLALLRFVDAAHVRLVYEPPDEPGEAPHRRAPDEYGGYGTDTWP